MHKHKAEFPEQSPSVVYKPCKLMAVTTKATVTPTPPQKTILLTPMIMKANSKIEKTLSSDRDFFVKDTPDKALAWSATPPKIKAPPHHH